MKKIILTIVFLNFILAFAKAQQVVDITKATSCENAFELNMLKFGPTTSPAESQTITNDVFAKKPHIVWYKFKADKTGMLLIDIIPLDSLDNYDFALYKSAGNTFCQDLKDKKVQPIAYNFDRVDITNRGCTGLSVHGDGKAYSNGVYVNKGDWYYLVLNNEYEKCKGHFLVLNYLETFLVKGKITDAENGQPIGGAIVNWENTRNPDEFFQTTTDKKGDFELKINVDVEAHTFPRYSLFAYSEKHFIVDTVILSKDLNKIEKNNYTFKLYKIKTGYTLPALNNIYFEPNELAPVASSDADLKKLLKQLHVNKNLVVSLEGHTNGFFPSTELDMQLSEGRAKFVYNYLVENGISPERMQMKGFGCTNQLYPAAKDENEEGYNRRVEINVLKY